MGTADRALSLEDWETAVSRAYYALYHAVIAVIEAKTSTRRRRWDHIEVQNSFIQQFTRKGFLFSTQDAATLEQAYRNRLVADYERIRMTSRTATETLIRARQLWEKIQGVIANV